MTWQPYKEPLRTTLIRNGTIAVTVGALIARPWTAGGLSRWPVATLLALWPSLGGHFVEVWFLNWLRPRLSSSRSVQTAARIAVWFVGGIILAIGMALTATALGLHPVRWFTWQIGWWVAGLGFIGIELIVHLTLQLRRCPNFYNGRG